MSSSWLCRISIGFKTLTWAKDRASSVGSPSRSSKSLSPSSSESAQSISLSAASRSFRTSSIFIFLDMSVSEFDNNGECYLVRYVKLLIVLFPLVNCG